MDRRLSFAVLFALTAHIVAPDPASADDNERIGEAATWEESAPTEEGTPAEPPRRFRGDEGHVSKHDPWEDPDERYLFVGIFYRHTWTPKFMLDLFLDAAPGANNPGAGFELTLRKKGFDIIGSLGWQSFSVHGPFLAPGDPIEDVEWISSNLSVLMASASFLWSLPFNDVFAFQYGLDVGLGMVFGSLHRTEAYPASTDTGYAPCTGEGAPNGAYCEPGGDYGRRDPRWTNGGSVPNVWFRLAVPHLALRVKPVKEVVARFDTGFDVFSGFFLGLAVAYAL